MPFTKVQQGCLYLDVAFDQASQTYAAVSAYSAPFEIFDDDGVPLNTLPGPQLLEPSYERSCLELIEPGSWRAVDG